MTIMMDMELNHLTEEERDRILNVLRKDDELRQKDAERIRKLKSDLKRIRLKGVIKAGSDPDKTCARCRESFGWFFNKGAICPQCQHKVCENCREKTIRNPAKWLCILCYKQMELDAMSGQWFMQKFRRSKRNKKTNKVITGQEIVKASIRRHPQTDEEEGEEGAQGPDSSRTGPNAEDVRKVSSNNNSSPKSSRSVGSNVEESSDTQSTASTSPGRKRPDIHDMGFPKESDKQRLFDLIRSKAPVIGKEEIEKPTVEVRKVSLSRYRSDSESSSSSGPSSPQFSARTESEFRYSDSIRSSIRSAISGVSAVSSEGRITIVTESNVSDLDSTSFASLPSSSSNINSPRESCSSLDRSMYDKENIQFKSSDSVIENPAHHLKLISVRTDTSEGPVILEDTEVTVRKVRTSKHDDSMSSDSDADTEQVSKIKLRKLPGGRSRSPSPDPRSRSRPNDVAATAACRSYVQYKRYFRPKTDEMSSSETLSNRPEIGEKSTVGRASHGDGQAGGVTNSPTGDASRSRETLSHSPALPEQGTNANKDAQQTAIVSHTAGAKTHANASIDDDEQGSSSDNNNSSIRDKVSNLLAKYGRSELLLNLDRDAGTDKAGGEGASASSVSDNSEKGSESGSISSYDIIEMEKTSMPAESSFEELVWDEDTIFFGDDGRQNLQEADWQQLHAALALSMPKHQNGDHSYEGRFLDDEAEEENDDYLNINYESPNIWAKSHCHDEDSDGLSVITELTEPDEDRDFLRARVYSQFERISAHRAGPGEDEEKDLGYFTLPTKGAVSRTESMRSTGDGDGEASRSSMTPPSDIDNTVIVDSDLSTISEISGTESSQDLISPDYKQNSTSSPGDDSIDDLLANVVNDRFVLEMDINSVYRENLKVLDETDLFGMVLPSSNSVKSSPTKSRKVEEGKKISKYSDSNVRSSDTATNRTKNIQMGKSLSDSTLLKVRTIESQAQQNPPSSIQDTVPPESKTRHMTKSVSQGALKKPDILGKSPDLKKQREGLRKVHRKSSSKKPEERMLERDEKAVDDSHMSSISDLTKMFDHPPPYYNARVNSDVELATEGQEAPLSKPLGDVEELVSSSDIIKEAPIKQLKPADVKRESEETISQTSLGSKSTEQRVSSHVERVTVEEVYSHVVLSLVEEDGSVENTKSSPSNRKKAAKLSKEETKEREQTRKEEKKKLKAEKKSNSGKDIKRLIPSLGKSKKDETSQKEEPEMVDQAVVLKEIQQSPNKRSPSPTVKAVKEKVEGSKSIQLRAIICEELEREVLGDVNESSLKETDGSDPSLIDSPSVKHKATSLNHQWKDQPSPVEVEVEEQLQAWKRKREQRRNRSSAASEENVERSSLKLDQLQPCVTDISFTTSTPLATQQEFVFQQTLPSEPVSSLIDAPTAIEEKAAATQVSDSASGSESIPEKNLETGNTSDELEEAFLRPRIPTPGGELDTRSQYRPHHHYRVNESSDELIYVDTDTTMTPDPCLDDSQEKTLLQSSKVGVPVVLLQGATSDSDDKEEDSEYEEKPLYQDRFREDGDYEESEELSYTTGTTGSIDTKQSNGHPQGGHMDSRAETSSLTESETGSTGPSSERSSHREHKSSISSVPSINVTHHDNEQNRKSPAFEKRTPVQSPVEPPGSSVEESDEIDDVLTKHTSPTHSIHSQKSSSLLSPFSGSKESIVSFYSDAGEGNYGNIPISGDILFGLEYNYKTGSLEVKIKQCRDLAPVDTKKKRSDPYVKVYLLPDKTKSGKRKTRVKKHTLNPVFDEVLKYAITKSELETRTLWVTVWHSDMFGRNDFLGEVTIPLDYYAFDEPSPQWYKLQERNASPISMLTYKGDLILSLKYVTADNAATNKVRAGNKRRTGKGELHVLLKEARNLTAVRANGFSDPFCKGYLLPDKTRSMKQKTPVVKRDCNPQWNHTLVFDDLTLEDLKDRSLELTVWDHDRFTSNDFLGGLRLNLGTGKIQGKEVDWMDSRGEEVSMWQSMLDRPNCWIDGSLMLRPNMAKRK